MTYENAQYRKERCRLQLLGSEPFDRALHVVRAVFGFRGKRPRRLVARSDVDAAEEDGMEFHFDIVLLQ